MHTPDKATFLARARQGNLIPVWRELLADQETPVSAYERLRRALAQRGEADYTFLLESVEGGEHIARYSFLGGRPLAVFRNSGDRVEIEHRDGRRECLDGVRGLDVIRKHMLRYQPVADPALPPFYGGAVGYIGYDAVPQFEPRVPLSSGAGLGWPDMTFLLVDSLVVFDRVRHTLKVVANAFIDGDAEAAYAEAVSRIDQICQDLRTEVPRYLLDAAEPPAEIEWVSNVDRSAFEASVGRAKEYIRAGDIIQVVLSQRFQATCDVEALDVHRALRSVNPSPYMFCLEFGDRKMIGSSPEIHVRCEKGEVEIRPIAGTRPRAADAEEDRRLEAELLADPKERAEHIMLVDLGRNDIGRVCTFGSVRVPDLMVIERYSHVMHIVSSVLGHLDPAHNAYDLMAATFPAGTVSGAPKIRAMEIIGELEEIRRGPYSGAVAYFGFSGDLDSCITIRTVLLEGDRAYVQAGAGIVADSDPAGEYEETRNKARGMLKALALSKRFAEVRRQEAP